MNFYTSGEILLSLVYACIFGLMMGVANSALFVVIDLIQSILRLSGKVIEASSDIRKIKSFMSKKNKEPKYYGKAALFFKDFVYLITYGILFSVLLYVSVDGALRLYMLAASIGSTYVSIRLGRYTTDKIFCFITNVISSLAFLFFILTLFLPLRLFRRIFLKKTKNV